MHTEPDRPSLVRPPGRVHVAVAFAGFLLLSLLQSPGRIVADTKYDLHSDPVGFLAGAAHLWTDLSFAGQVQNQAYGYFFPQGAFFALGDLVGLAPWLVGRLWWALLLTIAYLGLVRLAAVFGIGTTLSRIVAGVAFALSARMIAELGAISSEVWPVALAPWLMVPVALALQGRMTPRRAGAAAAFVLAVMGAVNAVATLAACLPAILWWALHRPNRTWWRLAAWWAPLSALVCLWWLIPLLLLGRFGTPFLDYIESAAVTTRWSSLTEVLRGASTWVQFVSPERAAGAQLTSESVFVLATGVLVALCLVGLVHRDMPHTGRLLTIAAIGLIAMAAAWVGPGGGPLAEPIRDFLDGPGAPLRNIHKFEPLLRIPLILGLAHLLGLADRRIRGLGGPEVRDERAHDEQGADTAGRAARRYGSVVAHLERDRLVAVALVAVLALGVTLAPAWLGRLAPEGGHEALPDHWTEAAGWLSENAPAVGIGADDDLAATTRALVVPGSSFGVQLWGVTRDEPLQPLAETPWAVRDSIPLQPAPAIRALDSVQRLFADARPAPGLAATLESQGIGFLVVRNDLDADSNAPRPALTHQVVDFSPGLERVAVFGEVDEPEPDADVVDANAEEASDAVVVADRGLRPGYSAIEIYAVDAGAGSESGIGDGNGAEAPASPTAPYLVDTDSLPVVAGGPESLARLDDIRGAGAGAVTRLLAADARAAGLDESAPALLTDTPGARETDFGRLDHSTSALRAPGDPLRSRGVVSDYAATVGDPEGGTTTEEALEAVERTGARWHGARLSASSSASDSSQAGVVEPGASTGAAIDGDLETAWRSGGFAGGFGEWLQVDLDEPADRLQLTVTVPEPSVGPAVSQVAIETENGTTTASVTPGEPDSVLLPPGDTSTVRITAAAMSDGTRGNRFEVSELALHSAGSEIEIERVVTLPGVDEGRPVSGWLLGQGFPGRAECIGPLGGRDAAVADDGPVRCSSGLGIGAEEPGGFSRSIDVPETAGGPGMTVTPELILRPRAGTALDELLHGSGPGDGQVEAAGESAVSDPRGGPSAAIDGDPSTSWYASHQETSPTLTLDLPEPVQVGALRILAGEGVVPAPPEEITVSTGLQRTRIDLAELEPDADGAVEVELPAETTERVTVRIDAHTEVISDGDGFEEAVPPGLAEVEVLDTAGAAVGADRPEPDAGIVIPCGEGPTVTTGHGTVDLQLSTTRADLLRGVAARATVCDGGELTVGPGREQVGVDPGPAFTVETLALREDEERGGEHGDSQQRAAVETLDWGPTARTFAVPASDSSRVFVVPESTNPGWSARLVDSDGQETARPDPVVVNGWQQGYLLEETTGESTLELTFAGDSVYRAALLTGPLALAAVLFAWLWRGRSTAREPTAGLRVPRWVAGAAVVTGAVVLGGGAGLAIAGVVMGLGYLIGRLRGPVSAYRALVGLSAGGVVAGAATLSRAPWPMSTYAGDEWAPQVLTLTGLVAAGTTILYVRASSLARASSAAREAARQGRKRWS